MLRMRANVLLHVVLTSNDMTSFLKFTPLTQTVFKKKVTFRVNGFLTFFYLKTKLLPSKHDSSSLGPQYSSLKRLPKNIKNYHIIVVFRINKNQIDVICCNLKSRRPDASVRGEGVTYIFGPRAFNSHPIDKPFEVVP